MRQRFDVENALKLFLQAHEAASNFHVFQLACTYELGDCYWKLMNWEKSIEHFTIFQTGKTKIFIKFNEILIIFKF